MAEEMLEVVDDNDNVIGIAPRKEIHAKGLLHREVAVMFITPKGELILQRRSKNKDRNPNLLTTTAAGHVEIGDSYEETVAKEVFEETGLHISTEDMVFIEKERWYTQDEITPTINDCFRVLYGYVFTGAVSDLKVEQDAAQGFEIYPLDTMRNPPDDLYQQLTSNFKVPERTEKMYKVLAEMIQKT